jgi:hypothetical protein
MLLLLVTLGWWGSRTDHRWLAGGALGLAVHVKPQYGLVVPLVWLAGEGAVAARAIVVGAAGTALGIAVLGVSPYVEWVKRVILDPGEARRVFPWNISIRAVLERALGAFGAGTAVVEVLVLVIDVAILALVIRALRRASAARGVARDWAWALAATTVLLVTPMMEEHHLVLMLFPLAVLLLARDAWPPRSALDSVLLVTGVVLLATRYSLVDFPRFQSGLPALALGAKVLGAGLIGAALVRRLATEPRAVMASG